MTARTPAPIIVAAVLGDEDHARLDGLRQKHFPPERNQLAAHLTMFHHLPPSVEGELRDRLARAVRQAAPAAALSGLIDLGRGVAFRVTSPCLDAIRNDLVDAFRGLLTPQDAAGWRAHITVQNKADPAAAKALLLELSGNFTPQPLKIAGLAAYFYGGGPWELIARYPFRS